MSGGMSTVERLRSPVPVADRIIAKRQEEIQDEEIAVRRCCRVAAAGRRCVIAYQRAMDVLGMYRAVDKAGASFLLTAKS